MEAIQDKIHAAPIYDIVFQKVKNFCLYLPGLTTHTYRLMAIRHMVCSEIVVNVMKQNPWNKQCALPVVHLPTTKVPVVNGITNSANIRSEIAKAVTKRFVMVWWRRCLYTAQHTRTLPNRASTFNKANKPASIATRNALLDISCWARASLNAISLSIFLAKWQDKSLLDFWLELNEFRNIPSEFTATPKFPSMALCIWTLFHLIRQANRLPKCFRLFNINTISYTM